MDRQVGSRLVLLASIVTMVSLAAASDASRILAAAIGVPLAFIAGAAFLLGLPYAATEKSLGHRLGWKRLADFFEHATVLAWFDLFVFWCCTGIAFMGMQSAGAGYAAGFGIALVAGFIAAVTDLYLSEEPDSQQAMWQRHPH